MHQIFPQAQGYWAMNATLEASSTRAPHRVFLSAYHTNSPMPPTRPYV